MGDSGGDATTSAEGRGGTGVRRGPTDTDEHGGHAIAAATTVAEDEGRSVETIVSPFEVSVLLVEFAASPAHPLVVC